MEENYKLEKEYRVSFEIFRDAYHAFQKKFIYPKSYVYIGLYLLLAVSFIVAAVKDPSNYFCYLLIGICLALAAREWYNPKKLRNNLVDTVKALGEPLYKIEIAEDFVEISTIEEPENEEHEEIEGEEAEEVDPRDFPDEIDPLPEKSRIDIDEDFRLFEYDKFFLLLSGKQIFYILPKEGFTEEELEIVRSLDKKQTV